MVAITGTNAEAFKAIDEVDDKVESLNKNIQSKSQLMEQSWKKLADGMTKVGTGMTLGVTAPILAAATASTKLASDLSETINKVDVTFAENASAVEQWSKNSIKNMGLAQQSALDSAALYGDMANGMGLNTKAAASMSTSLVQLSADMASFKNVSQDRASTALAGIFTGETEALKGLGIVMTQANLQQYAYSQGILKNIQDMNQAEQVQLRYQYVMSVTANAHGDFARTGGGAANQTRMLTEQFKEAGAQLGEQLLPEAIKLLKWANQMVAGFNSLDPSAKKIIITIAGVAAAIGPMLLVGGKLITTVQTIKSVFGGVGPAFTKFIAGLTSTAAAETAAGVAGGATAAGATAAGNASKAAVPGVMAFGTALQTALGVVGLAAMAVVALLAVFSQFDAPDEEVKKFVEANDEVIASAKEGISTYQEATTKLEAQAVLAEELTGKLAGLQEKTSLTKAEQNEMASIISQLNSIYPSLGLYIEQNTGKLNKNTSEIRELTKAMQQQAEVAADQEARNKLEEQRNQLLIDQKSIEMQLKGVEKDRNAEWFKFFAKWPGFISMWKIFDNQTASQAANIAALIEQYQEGQITLEQLTGTLNDLSNATDANTISTSDNTQAVQLNTEALVAKLNAKQMLTQEELALGQQMLEAGYTFTSAEEEQLKAQTKAQEDAKNEYKRIMDERVSIATDAFNRIDQGTAISVQNMIKNLNENASAVQDWTTNINILASSGLDKGFLQTLKDKGPEAGAQIKAMIDYMKKSGDTSFAEFNKAYERAFQSGVNSVAGIMTSPDAVNIASNMIDANAQGVALNPSLSESLMQQVIGSKESMAKQVGLSDFPGIGEDMIRGAIQGIDSMAPRLYAKADEIAAETANRMRRGLDVHSPSGVTEDIFENVGWGAVYGLEKMIGKIKQTSSEFAAAAVPQLPADLYQYVDVKASGNSKSTQFSQHLHFYKEVQTPSEAARIARREAARILES